MVDKKEIMVFFDLEGTIIEEEFGEINEEKIVNILDSLSELEQITGSKINMHIVSPVFMHTMEETIDKIDRIIFKYNRLKGKNLKEIQGAVAYPDTNYIDDNYLYDRIIPMNLSALAQPGEKDQYGKFDYVRNWIESMKDRISFSIYGGNGFNDIKAMEYIKSNKGFVICPENSYIGVKKLADYVSEKHASEGIKDGIDFINREIEKRRQRFKEVNTQGNSEGEEIGID